jgi:hypothetical protein
MSPDTPVATPDGPVPIASLEAGDLVYSVHSGSIQAVPVLAVHRTPVTGHRVVSLRFENGAVLEGSPGHPTADGRTFAGLHAGDLIDGAGIVSARLTDYPYTYTHDILPDSDTGSYFASGVKIGSTLFSCGR